MNILAVDATEDALSVALQAGGEVFSVLGRPEQAHDELLLPRVGRLLARAGISFDRLDGIAAASGPGRFTGIRIGMAFAAVAGRQCGKPALAISRLEAAAWSIEGKIVAPVIPGWREERYYQVFRRGARGLRPFGPPQWARAEDWPRIQAELEGQGAVVGESTPRARDILGPALARLSSDKLPAFEPLYLKPAGYERKAHPPRPAR
ncbi:MAG: tRNA (adenosine(37)-N6)-threonylcarbamoyltransferase complex dimerization subunit type 1 TsaB [Elusimicrobia bacterium]|nr:tRNA (adenosine(37)-N6)-threonylcarbamoyltransferase complex dimerization subunit type 1 TsaB [Elusimicrobiota bacterium]